MFAVPIQDFGIFYALDPTIMASSARLILQLKTINEVEFSTPTQFSTLTESDVVLIAGVVTGSTLAIITVVIVIVTVILYCVWRRPRSKSTLSSRTGNIQVPTIR